MSEQDPRARQLLDALGIELYVRRDRPVGSADADPVVDELALPVATHAPSASQQPPVEQAPNPVQNSDIPSAPVTATAELSAVEPPSPPAGHFDDLNPPPIDEIPGYLIDADEDEPNFEPPALPAVATLGWPQLKERVANCENCPELVANRTQSVFGIGNQQADWLIIGEAPGVDEDARGEPFVGPAGQLLNRMLRAIGLKRQQVYIANVLKCRPPKNRDPHVDEMHACEAYLQRQIALIQPKVILIVGRIAAQSLLQSHEPVGRLRGLHHYGDTPVVVTYHPAYLLRSPIEKRKSWQDLRLALNVARGEVK